MSASSSDPVETATKTATFFPCQASGITGSGGAVVRLTNPVTSSGASAAHSRKSRSTATSASAG